MMVIAKLELYTQNIMKKTRNLYLLAIIGVILLISVAAWVIIRVSNKNDTGEDTALSSQIEQTKSSVPTTFEECVLEANKSQFGASFRNGNNT